MPGTYTVSMTLGDESYSADVEIEADPRRPMTMTDRRTRQDALLSLHALAKPLYEAAERTGTLSDQMDDAEALLGEHADAPASLGDELAAIQAELEEIGDGLQEARRWAGVAGAIQGSSTLPTEDQMWQIDAAWDAVPPLVERLNALIGQRVPAFNASLDAEGVRPDPGERLEVPRRGN
jgi:hypothetical protein